MKVTTQASLRSAFGWQPTSCSQRAASPKTSAAAARLAASYSSTDDALMETLAPPIDAKPVVRVSSGRVSGVLMVPSKSDTAFWYSVRVRILRFGPPLRGSRAVPAPPPAPPVLVLPPPVCGPSPPAAGFGPPPLLPPPPRARKPDIHASATT